MATEIPGVTKSEFGKFRAEVEDSFDEIDERLDRIEATLNRIDETNRVLLKNQAEIIKVLYEIRGLLQADDTSDEPPASAQPADQGTPESQDR